MTSEFFVARRRVVQQLGWVLGAATVDLSGPVGASPADVPLLRAAEEFIVHRGSAAIIGEAYLARFEHERSAELLVHKIRERLATDLQRIEPHDLVEAIRTDFENGDIINLHGWLLSRSEARLCALFAV